ncbi:hypothetical protein [Ileibacterium valens]|uniref:hypothetical protein n=1 Tax=Ileibacterium valens TaxID=1862668 RepID=UPI0024BA663A|nr:hypothetical protein [Ileibacterium valens]
MEEKTMHWTSSFKLKAGVMDKPDLYYLKNYFQMVISKRLFSIQCKNHSHIKLTAKVISGNKRTLPKASKTAAASNKANRT